MDEGKSLVPRDRWAGSSLEVLPAQPPFHPWDELPRAPHLLDYLKILRKHKWLILSFALTLVTVVTIEPFRMPPVYEATARVQIDRESQSVLPFQPVDPYDVDVDFENYIVTQAKILQSETLALHTI